MKKIIFDLRPQGQEGGDFYILLSIISFFLLINFAYFSLNLMSSSNVEIYAFNELFVNYQAGFIRRGLLGEIAWQFYHQFSVNPETFFSIIFFTIYLAQVFLFFYIFKKYIISKFIFILIVFSPSLLLFHIYNPDLYFLKDSLIKFALLLHAFIFYKFSYLKKDNKKYFKFLNFLIVPLLFLLILIHEYQVFSLSLHFLISLGTTKSKNEIKRLILFYIPLIFPIILISIFFGDQDQFNVLSEILSKFEIQLNPYLGGGLYHYIGGFYKWHFFYFTYRDFVNLFFSVILSVIIFYILFSYLIKNKILSFHSKYQKEYLKYFIPVLIPFFLATDHGRNLSFVSFYLISFYLILKLNTSLLIKKTKIIYENIINKYLIISFLFFYVFMWKLNQVAGFGLRGIPNDIFQSSLFAEFVKFIKFLYIFIDVNIFDLPEIKL